jgi:hypothetical protein
MSFREFVNPENGVELGKLRRPPVPARNSLRDIGAYTISAVSMRQGASESSVYLAQPRAI